MRAKPLPENSSIVIAGLARNCEAVVNLEIKKISSAFKCFKKISWIIIESDSDDGTVEKIKSLSSEFDISLLSLGNLRDSLPKRTERIARCRNEYMKAIKDDKYHSYDYLAVVDLDGVNSELSARSVDSCWNTDVEWDACFANQSTLYYDIWALRHQLWSPNDCWRSSEFFIKIGVSPADADFAAVHSRKIRITQEQAPIEVDSAFGGLAIYRKETIKNAFYVGVDEEGSEFCEHVSFHKMLKEKGAKMYIFPSLINGGWNDRTNQLRLRYKIKDKLFLFKHKLKDKSQHLILSAVTKIVEKETLKKFLKKKTT